MILRIVRVILHGHSLVFTHYIMVVLLGVMLVVCLKGSLLVCPQMRSVALLNEEDLWPSETR